MTDDEFEELDAELSRRLGQRNCPRKKLDALWKLRSRCRDCNCDDSEFYMVSREIWESAFAPGVRPRGCLCLNCLEKRLGRRLAREEIGDGVGGIFDGRRRRRRKERICE